MSFTSFSFVPSAELLGSQPLGTLGLKLLLQTIKALQNISFFFGAFGRLATTVFLTENLPLLLICLEISHGNEELPGRLRRMLMIWL